MATRPEPLPGPETCGRVISIHQPAYLPWLGYFDKIRAADCFVYLDSVQFQKQSFQNRNKIRTADGWTWLTVPVETKGKLYDTTLAELAINNRQDWRRKHLRALEMHYRRAPCFETIMPVVTDLLERDWEHLSALCFEMLVRFNRLLGIETEILKASELPPVEGQKSDLVLELCQQLGATTYVSGSLGRDYLEAGDFEAAGIELRFQDYAHPTYRQVYTGFEPYMGAVDLLMNEPDAAAII